MTIRLAVAVALGATLAVSFATAPTAAQPTGVEPSPAQPPPAQPAPPPPRLPQPPGGPPATAAEVATRVLTLDEVVNIALETQPQIQATLGDYAAARYRVDQAMAPLLPQLAASASASRSQNATLTTSSTGVTSSATFTREPADTLLAQIALSQLLFDFGKNLAGRDAARKLAEVSLEDVELQRQLISLSAKEAYTNMLFAQRLIRVQQQAVDRAELNLRSARGFFDVGTRPKSDVARAEVDVANARVDLIRARNAERLARVALNTAMGIEVTTPTQVQDNLVYEAFSVDRAQARVEGLRQRPEYRQAKLRVEAAEAFERQAFRNFFPDITGSGTYGGVRSDLAEVWTLTLSMSWSLYDGGGRIARYREAKANLEAARARVRATELDIAQGLEQAQISLEEAQERIQAAQAAVASAQENFRLAQGRFDAGVGTILELTDAQLALTQTQNTETQALADYRISRYRLDRARGLR